MTACLCIIHARLAHRQDRPCPPWQRPSSIREAKPSPVIEVVHRPLIGRQGRSALWPSHFVVGSELIDQDREEPMHAV